MSEDKAIQTCEEDFEEIIIYPSPSPGLSPMDNEPELTESIHDLLEDYIKDEIIHMSKESFMTQLNDDITHILFQNLTDAGICSPEEYNSIHSLVCEETHEWFLHRTNPECPQRCSPHSSVNVLVSEFGQDEEFVESYLKDKLLQIRKKDAENPAQRTPEWYLRRYNMLTASNLWQAFSTDAQKNRLIYEKCKPLETAYTESNWIKTEGSLHWGVRYEPLSVKIYEYITGAKVDFFGCIVHSEYPFIGASPDGIVVNPESPLFGRLVEIKNIYNREMDGIPSEAYWTQMQIQMQCCDLEACDFMETRFKQYESAEEFWAPPAEDDTIERTYKGVILQFVPRDSLSNIPRYKYSPINPTPSGLYEWIEATKAEVAEVHILFMTHYWYLDEICMTTVFRNDAWFRAALPQIQELWETIQKERVSGYEHRAPKKRVSSEVIVIKAGSPPKSACPITLTEEEIHED
jgi:putative phage-type endonuclease